MGGGHEHDEVGVVALGDGCLIGQAGTGNGEVGHLQNEGVLSASVRAVLATDDVGNQAALLVSRASQRHDGGLAGDAVGDLNGVADSVDVGIVGAHLLVNDDSALDARLQAAGNSQVVFGANANGQDNHVGCKGLLISHLHLELLALVDETGDVDAQLHMQSDVAHAVL